MGNGGSKDDGADAGHEGHEGHAAASWTLQQAATMLPVEGATKTGQAALKWLQSITSRAEMEAPVPPEALELLPPAWRAVAEAAATTTRESMMRHLLEHHVKQEGKAQTPEELPFFTEIATVADVQEMADASLEGEWLDRDKRRRWGLETLTPGAQLLYTGAFMMPTLSHHCVYLGFFRTDGKNTSAALRGALQAAYDSLVSGDDSACVAAHKDAFRTMHTVRGGGGGDGSEDGERRLERGVDLVMELAIDHHLVFRVQLKTLRGFVRNARSLKSSILLQRNADDDTASSMMKSGLPLWQLRAMCALGLSPYSVELLNCEHVARYINTGLHASHQADIVAQQQERGFVRAVQSVPVLRAAVPVLSATNALYKLQSRVRPKRTADGYDPRYTAAEVAV